jgi:prevent-host-death family protein
MKTIGAGAFKAQCLALMDEVQAKRVSVIITKRRKPVAKLVPILQGDAEKDSFIGRYKGIEILGDIVSPIVPSEDWDMLK